MCLRGSGAWRVEASGGPGPHDGRCVLADERLAVYRCAYNGGVYAQEFVIFRSDSGQETGDSAEPGVPTLSCGVDVMSGPVVKVFQCQDCCSACCAISVASAATDYLFVTDYSGAASILAIPWAFWGQSMGNSCLSGEAYDIDKDFPSPPPQSRGAPEVMKVSVSPLKPPYPISITACMFSPESISGDPSNHTLIAATSEGEVLRFDSLGNHLSTLDTGMPRPIKALSLNPKSSGPFGSSGSIFSLNQCNSLRRGADPITTHLSNCICMGTAFLLSGGLQILSLSVAHLDTGDYGLQEKSAVLQQPEPISSLCSCGLVQEGLMTASIPDLMPSQNGDADGEVKPGLSASVREATASSDHPAIGEKYIHPSLRVELFLAGSVYGHVFLVRAQGGGHYPTTLDLLGSMEQVWPPSPAVTTRSGCECSGDQERQGGQTSDIQGSEPRTSRIVAVRWLPQLSLGASLDSEGSVRLWRRPTALRVQREGGQHVSSPSSQALR